jgi:hypothetical protein
MQVDLWQLITLLLMPLTLGAFGLIWRQLREIERRGDEVSNQVWSQINDLKKALAQHQVDSERRYVSDTRISELKSEIFGRFDRLESKVDKVLAADVDVR